MEIPSFITVGSEFFRGASMVVDIVCWGFLRKFIWLNLGVFVVLGCGMACEVAQSGASQNTSPVIVSQSLKKGDDGPAGLSPIQLVTRYTWISGDYKGLWKSVDAGKNWIKVFPVDDDGSATAVGTRCLSMINEKDGYAVFENSVVRTYDGGDSWEIQTQLESQFSTLGCYFSDINHGWLVGWYFNDEYFEHPEYGKGFGGILFTADGGVSWKAIDIRDVTDERDERGESACSEVTFLSEKVGFVVGDFGAIMTKDGGRSWKQVKITGGKQIAVSKIWAGSKRYLIVYSPHSKKAFFSRDGGIFWSPLSFSFEYGDLEPSFAFGLSNVIFATLTDVYRSDNRGRSWNKIESSQLDTNGLTDLQVVTSLDGEIVVLGMDPVSHKSRAYFSSDNGKSWIEY